MPSRIPSHQYGQAVLDHVQTGAYPESEEVIAAELPPSALPEVSKLIQQAREDVKVRIPQRSLIGESQLTRLSAGHHQET